MSNDPSTSPPGRRPHAGWLLLILLVALAIREWGARRANLIFDERAHWALAETIDLRPGHLHLVSRTLDHPLLSIYILRLASLLFGTSNFGLRLPYVLAGTATILPVYFLACRAFSPRAGLLAAALLAVDLFHACWSRVFMPEVLMLLFAALAMLQFLRALERPTASRFAVLGLLLGLAWLAKEPAILLLPAFWLYLLVTPRHRSMLKNPRCYLALAVFAAVIAPDLIWNARQWSESYLSRDLSLAGQTPRISLKPLSLYLGDAFRLIMGRNALGEDYFQGNMFVCHLEAGIIYLASVVMMLRFRDRPAVRAMIVVFLTIFGVFLVLPGGGVYEPFWWASISLIPAVVCAGGAIELVGWPPASIQGNPDRPRSPSRNTLTIIVALALIASLGFATVKALSNKGPYEPRASVRDFAGDFLAKGRAALRQGDLKEAEGRFIYVLNIAGPQAGAYCGLAQVAYQRHQVSKAARFLKKCRALDPKHAGALELQRKMLEEP